MNKLKLYRVLISYVKYRSLDYVTILSIQIVEILLKKSASIQEEDSDKLEALENALQIPLHLAVKNGHAEVILKMTQFKENVAFNSHQDFSSSILCLLSDTYSLLTWDGVQMLNLSAKSISRTVYRLVFPIKCRKW